MLQKIKGMVTVLAIAGLAVLPALAAARGAGHGPHGDGPERMAEFLGLSDEQKATWTQAHEEFRTALEPAMEAQREAADKLHKLLEADQPEALAVGKLVVAMHQQRKQLDQQHEALKQRLRATLTQEQQVKFDAAHALHGGRGAGHGPGHGFGPGLGRGRFFPGPGGPQGPRGARPQDRPF
jgi:Spy/CpxP family protein refolding chaperone